MMAWRILTLEIRILKTKAQTSKYYQNCVFMVVFWNYTLGMPIKETEMNQL